MVLDYRIFINGGQKQFKNKIALLEKANYPTTVDGLIRLGLDESNGEKILAFMKEMGLRERETCSLFVFMYMKAANVKTYTARRALVDWVTRKGFDAKIRESMSALAAEILESETGPKK
ncbi:MAG TPA: hypothetical protein DCW60_01230 [Sutterella sp.]|nr:hypothetical protein [Sutterella sp.]